MVSSDLVTMFEDVLSVQELIKKPLTSVPQCYVRQQCHNEPTLFPDETSSQELPIISLRKLIHGEDTELELEKLNSACRDWGFFQLVEHGISPAMLKTLKDEVEGFFMLPLEEKMKYKIRPGDVEGYGHVIKAHDTKLDWGDRLYFKTNPRSTRKLLPQFPSSFR
ncbi:hypothetical protein V8G54_033547 [Vigna mungo]|uniref:Non-haem dioxygenase N-terminal domain-containing protein n=1 Tax=Vigna mungo TaxID=3915 RepID=A0AAQ3MPJ2_VIGMU